MIYVTYAGHDLRVLACIKQFDFNPADFRVHAVMLLRTAA
jgi:hypothetical protein